MRLALRGLRNMDAGNEKISDQLERAALRRRAMKIYLQSLGAAAALTAAVWAIPPPG